MERSDKGRSVNSVLLTIQELVPTHIQRCVSDTIFDGTDLDEANLKQGIAATPNAMLIRKSMHLKLW